MKEDQELIILLKLIKKLIIIKMIRAFFLLASATLLVSAADKPLPKPKPAPKIIDKSEISTFDKGDN